jgi:hypothetical protein
VLTTDTTDGFAFTVDVNLDGTTTVTNYSSQTSVVPQTGSVPEPSSMPLVLAGLMFVTWLRRSRKTETAAR